MKIYRRDTGAYEEEQEFQAGLLRLLYETAPGRVLLKLAIHPAVSRLYGLYQHSPLSRKNIRSFADTLKPPFFFFCQMIVPPPITVSPSYITSACPFAAGVDAGSSKITFILPSPIS